MLHATNIALDAIRAPRGLSWGIPAMLLAVPYLYAASFVRVVIDNGAPDWLRLVSVNRSSSQHAA
ncbi:MAG: hypothetical protein VB093_11910, partial [Propionicimonas sp.]|nr:hypothetical protein [Propionicimonas sp.]